MAKANGGNLTLAPAGDVSIEMTIGHAQFGSYYIYKKIRTGNSWHGELIAEGNSADSIRDIHVFPRSKFKAGDVIEWTVRMHPMANNPNYNLNVSISQPGNAPASYDYPGQFTTDDKGVLGGRVVGDYVVVA